MGEILWDLLPTGAQMGGAPANFAYHARALGAEAGVVTRVGSDALGQALQRRLEAWRLPLDLVQVDAQAPTGTVTVALSGEGIPSYTIHEPVAWDRLEPTDATLSAARGAAAICFGSLAQRAEPSRGTIHHPLRLSPAGALRIFDINLRQHFYSREVIEASLRLANVLKLNETELPVLAVGLLQNVDLDDINLAANEVARHVCSCAGATLPSPESMRESFVGLGGTDAGAPAN